MKKVIPSLLVSILLYSCVTNKDIHGEYYYSGTFGEFRENYYLKLKKDSFRIKYTTQDAYPRCSGIWKLKNNIIYLKCNEEKVITNMLSKGYMNKREYQIKIINKDSLKLINENVILKRQQ